MPSLVTAILAGGRGTRLYPLTKERAKPSVPIAGKYRLIDIPMSNCVHSGLLDVFIITQFNSASLNRHVGQTYHFGDLSTRSVRLLVAQQTYTNADWYQGTADAIRHNLRYLLETKPENILILAGDHLYRMDYRPMITYHLQHDADITVGAIPVPRDQTHRFGVLRADKQLRVEHFVEKPKSDAVLEELVTTFPPNRLRLQSEPRGFLASMGIYIFSAETLREYIEDDSNIDFGQHILPKSIHQSNVYAYLFDDYWEDIGTIDSFFHANLALRDTVPQFNFYDESMPIFTYRYHLPGAKVNQSQIEGAMLCEGSIIDRSDVRRSIIGLRSVVRSETTIENSILMGADRHESQEQMAHDSLEGLLPLGIGSRCVIRNAIIDKNARIGDDVKLVNATSKEHADEDSYSIRDSIIVVPKNTVIPSGTVI